MHKLYKFVNENTEFHCNKNDYGYEFICLVSIKDIGEFYHLIKESFGTSIFDDEGVELSLKDGYVGLDIYDYVCDNDTDEIWFKLFRDIKNR